jgi:hypothetical protein
LITHDVVEPITEYIVTASDMHCTIIMTDMIHVGMRAEYNEITVSRKYQPAGKAVPLRSIQIPPFLIKQ